MNKKIFKLPLITASLSILCSANIFAASWQQQGNQWKYEQDGQFAADTWQLDQGSWYHFDENGIMQTGWLLDQGSWYYLDHNGAMLADTSRMIDGIDYNFNADGRWIETAAASWWSGNTYYNSRFNYKLTVPEGFSVVDDLFDSFANDLEDTDSALHTIVSKDNAYVYTMHVGRGTYDTIDNYFQEFAAELNYGTSIPNIGEDLINGIVYKKLEISWDDIMGIMIYGKETNEGLFHIVAFYEPSDKPSVDQIIASIQPLN